ncbi:MAG: hypothetical protein JXR25_05760 [Pontiellaceae bacterium]|nr:hypothetical protein [Pontiellaceae bacterium]MBN2784313.1 hypothetical protein [Pontiellaceae bacterium]
MAGNIQYWEPVESAWKRMKHILFKPFSLEKWMVMGFAAWIAGLNSGSGGGGSSGYSNFNNASNQPHPGSDIDWSGVTDFWHEYGALVILGSVALFILFTAIGMAFAWLHGRGCFIFLDNVLQNRGAIVEPWKKYRKQGNSLFIWNLIIGFSGLAAFLLLALTSLPLMIAVFSGAAPSGMAILGIMFGGMLMLIYSLAISFVQMLVNGFMVPIMLKHDLRIREAWTYFKPIFKPAFGSFLLYGLLMFAVSMIISFALLFAMLLTCCCLWFILMIPYIGTVLLLPVLVFQRLISIEFLEQFGEHMDGVDPQIPPLPPELPAPETSIA